MPVRRVTIDFSDEMRDELHMLCEWFVEVCHALPADNPMSAVAGEYYIPHDVPRPVALRNIAYTGFAAEMALARWLGVPYVKLEKNARDVAGYEVRATRLSAGCLALRHPRDWYDGDKNGVYVLGTVDSAANWHVNAVTLCGWQHTDIIKNDANTRLWPSGYVWAMPQSALHPMGTLPAHNEKATV